MTYFGSWNLLSFATRHTDKLNALIKSPINSRSVRKHPAASVF